MKERLATEFRVGMFVTAGLVLIMMIIFMIGGEHQFFQRDYTLYSNFDDIAGLRVGATVQLAGLKVGFVDGIRLAQDKTTTLITVKMKVQRKYQYRIHSDSEASIETQGLLGDKFIYITMGSGDKPALKDNEFVTSKKTLSLFAMADKAGSIIDNIDAAAKSFREVMDTFKGEKGESEIKAIVASIRKITEQAEKGKGLMHALFFDPEGEKVVAQLSRAMKAVGDVAGQAEGEGASSIVANMRSVSADLKLLMASIRRGEGTLGKLITDPALYDDLRALVGRANRNALLRSVVRSTIKENEQQMLK
ncbi:MAG: MlaD family protein [Patescibacteria group bacterium]